MTVKDLSEVLEKKVIFHVYGNNSILLFDSSENFEHQNTWEEIKDKTVSKMILVDEEEIDILVLSKKCANPKCEKYFDVTATNTKKKYCCNRCATMVAKREYRKRRRKDKKAPPVGKDS